MRVDARWALSPILAVAVAAQARAPLTGVVVDPDGKPVAGAQLQTRRAEGMGTNLLDRTATRDPRLVDITVSAADGSFSLQTLDGLPCELRVEHPAWAAWGEAMHLPVEGLRIGLLRPCTFAGQVCVEAVGVAAEIHAWTRSGYEILRARTDAQGGFRFTRLPPGPVTIEVAPDTAASPDSRQEVLVPGETLTRTLQVPAGRTFRGRILDAASHAPIVGARLGEGWSFHKCVESGDDGGFVLRGWGSHGYGEVVCEAPGFVPAYIERADIETADANASLDFRLERGHAVVGVVVDPAGKPLPDIYVAGIGMHHDGTNQYHNWVSGRTDTEGRFRLAGLHAELDQTLLVRCDGWATLVYHLPPAQRGVRDAGTIAMRPPRFLRGRVVDDGGRPVPRLKLALWGANLDREALGKLAPDVGPNGWSLLRMYLAMRVSKCNAQGEFAFGDLATGVYSLVAYGAKNERLGQIKGIMVTGDGEVTSIALTLRR